MPVMRSDIDVDHFIRRYVTRRPVSLLKPDLEKNHEELEERLNGKKVLVIGGAGTIGSFYIKALLKYRLSSLVVVDINENGLTELVRDLRSSTGYNIPAEFITYPMNFGDRVFEKMFRSMAPFDIVANFAAHKHVQREGYLLNRGDDREQCAEGTAALRTAVATSAKTFLLCLY